MGISPVELNGVVAEPPRLKSAPLFNLSERRESTCGKRFKSFADGLGIRVAVRHSLVPVGKGAEGGAIWLGASLVPV